MDNFWRQPLGITVAALLKELGFKYSEKNAHQILTDIIKNLIKQIGSGSRAYCELTGRTEPVLRDVLMAIENAGISLENIDAYSRRPGRIAFSPLDKNTWMKPLGSLQVGQIESHPPYIPSYFPPFPELHSYKYTPTYKKPVTDYSTIREKTSSYKRDIEGALTKFVARTSKVQPFFFTQDGAFPIVPCESHERPYIKALLTHDQEVDEFEHDPNLYSASVEEEGRSEHTITDNPYLLPVKMPQKKKRKQSTSFKH